VRSRKCSRFRPLDDLVSTSCEGSARSDNVDWTYSIDTANFEPVCAASIVAAVHEIAHHQNDVEQIFKLVGVAKVVAGGLQQVDGLRESVELTGHTWNSRFPATCMSLQS
jgi:hypothetical protein